MGNFPVGWEILHDFCGMGVHGFDKMFFCLFVSYPTNDNYPLRAQVKWPVHCNQDDVQPSKQCENGFGPVQLDMIQ